MSIKPKGFGVIILRMNKLVEQALTNARSCWCANNTLEQLASSKALLTGLMERFTMRPFPLF